MYALAYISAGLWRLLPICAVIVAILPFPAQASMMFCNRTQTPIEAAIGYQDKGNKWISEGWWRIEPGLCARVYSKPLEQKNNYFYYAHSIVAPKDNSQPFVWDGDYRFCAAIKAFRTESTDDCEQKGYLTKGFRKIDIAPKNADYMLEFGNQKK
jgi:uncharacterized membrane protein